MAKDKNRFLKFSAYSIKDAIIRRLAADTKFSDAIYADSNIQVLIDLVSYMYQCLVYQLNSAASESMFADTQLYENINRLVSLIGYNPKGCSPASLYLSLDNVNEDGMPAFNGRTVPKFAYFDTGIVDSRGKPICFSTVDDVVVHHEKFRTVKVCNGRWRLYSSVFTASGADFETFRLDGVKSDSSDKKFVAGEYIRVWTYSGGKWQQWAYDPEEVFVGNGKTSVRQPLEQAPWQSARFTSVYGKADRVFSARLGQDKTYTVKFGDGVTGAKPAQGDRVYVWYLDTNGPDGQVSASQLASAKFELKHSAADFGISQDQYDGFFTADFSGDISTFLTEANVPGLAERLALKSSDVYSFSPEEGVEDIRRNAPSWFRTGDRLITARDYEYFVRNSVAGQIADVKCMNNWEYLATFFKWLYDAGAGRTLADGTPDPDPSAFINVHVLDRQFQYADAVDGNNTYLFVKQNSNDADKDVNEVESILDEIQDKVNAIKTMTTEVVVMPAVQVCFDICAAPVEYARARYMDAGEEFQAGWDGAEPENFIEITLDDDAAYVSSIVRDSVAQIILNALACSNCMIGQNVRFRDMLDEIYAINGVSKVRTVFQPKEGFEYFVRGQPTFATARAIDGLSFATWTKEGFYLSPTGLDMSVSNSIRQLEDFQFPVPNKPISTVDALVRKIKVIKKSLSNVSTIKF